MPPGSTVPGMSTAPLQTRDPGPAPTSIHAVFWLMIAQTAFNVFVGLPLAYLSRDAILAAMPETPGVDKEAIWQGSFGFTVVLSLGMAVLWLLFAVKLRQGRNWARITMIVLTAVGLVFTPINLANGGAAIPATVVPALIGMAVALLIMILLLTEPAKSWTPAKSEFLKANPPF